MDDSNNDDLLKSLHRAINSKTSQEKKMNWQARYHLHSVFEDPLRTKYYTQWIIGAFACRLAPKIMCIKIYTTPNITHKYYNNKKSKRR